jgi:hypothetical protein
MIFNLVKVVRVEGSLEADDDEDEGREHGGRVQKLQLLLPLAPEQPVNERACKKNRIQFLRKNSSCLLVENRLADRHLVDTHRV